MTFNYEYLYTYELCDLNTNSKKITFSLCSLYFNFKEYKNISWRKLWLIPTSFDVNSRIRFNDKCNWAEHKIQYEIIWYHDFTRTKAVCLLVSFSFFISLRQDTQILYFFIIKSQYSQFKRVQIVIVDCAHCAVSKYLTYTHKIAMNEWMNDS